MNKGKTLFFTLFFLLITGSNVFATDGLVERKEYFSSNFLKEPKPHSPHKASVYSAVFPGLGQIYNKKYWKAPIIYIGMGALTYSIISNRKQFREYQNEMIARTANDSASMNPAFASYPYQYLQSNRDFHRNNRDLSIVGLVAFYALNIVDATVDAHLFNFDVDRSLSLRAKPVPLLNQQGFNAGTNIGLVFQF